MYWSWRRNDRLDFVFEGILTEKEFRVNEPMSRHTTYGIGGPADVFVTPTNEETLKRCCAALPTAACL